MRAIIIFNDKSDVAISGEELRISTSPLTDEFKVFDGDRCIFYTDISEVHHSAISGDKEVIA